MKKISIVFWIILFLASVLRLYQLGSVPASPDWDEVALGYNAYSLLQTGRDEYGSWLPASIKSFGDYKPPVYAYLTVPSVYIFGLTVFAVRLPSAFMGIIAVIGVYFLAKILLARSKQDSSIIPLVAMFLLAISPWHLQFSRIAFEANIGVTLHIWAITMFLYSLKKRYFLPLSAMFFSLGMYAYHSERVFLPLLGSLLLVAFRKELFQRIYLRYTVGSALLAVVLLIPLVFVLFDASAVARLKGTSSFTDQVKMLNRSIEKLQDDNIAGNKLGVFFDNRRLVWAKTFITGYLSHFSLQWLFLAGDNPRHHAPSMGLLYLWELPFLLLGIFIVLKLFDSKTSIVLIGWVLLAPIAASVTTGLPHGVRTLTFLPTFQLFTAVGLAYAFYYLKKCNRTIRWTGFAILCISFLYGLLYYFTMYYVHMDAEVSEDWQYGYRQVVEFTEGHKKDYEKVVVSTALDQSYIFFLFYTAYNPSLYLERGGTGGMYGGDVRTAFDSYEFRPIHWETEIRDGSILYVGAPRDIPFGNIKRYSYLNGKPAFELADR